MNFLKYAADVNSSNISNGILKNMGIEPDYIIIGAVAGIIVLLIMFIVLLVQHNKLNKKYNKFMSGEDGRSLEKAFVKRFDEVDELKKAVSLINKNIDAIKNKMLLSYQKMAILKYDAFAEMGGKLSFSLCMLDDNNSGFIITSMHSTREGCYTYVKEIIRGEAFVLLSEEEKQVLENAKSVNE